MVEKVYPSEKAPNLDEVVNKEDFYKVLTFGESSMINHMALYLPLVLSRQKRGMTEGFFYNDWEQLSELLYSMDIPHKVDVKDIEESQDLAHSLFFISNSVSSLEDINVELEDENFGRFLGVPEEDNSWWKYEDCNTEDVSPMPDYLDLEKEKWPDLKYAKMVSWVCKPERDRLRETIEIGKSWYSYNYKLNKTYGLQEPMKESLSRVGLIHSAYQFREDLPKHMR